VLKNGDVLTHPLLDSHTDLVRYFELPDTTAYHQHFAKVELTPADWLDPATWRFRLDEDTAPGWWEDVATQVEATLRDRARSMIITTGRKDLILEGCWILAGDAEFVDMLGGTLQRMDGGTLQRMDGGTLQRMDGGTLQGMCGGTLQRMCGGTLQRMYGGTLQEMCGGTLQEMYDGTLQEMCGGTLQAMYGGTLQEMLGGTLQARGPRAALGAQARKFLTQKATRT
jgi:hypothetical protein